MSQINVTVERIEKVLPHPNADRLEVAVVLGTQTVVAKGEWKEGDLCVFFPPDICIPPDVVDCLGVRKYLRGGWKAGLERVPNSRVAATRLRGEPSFGFIAKPGIDEALAGVGANADFKYGAWKHDPPEKGQFVKQGIARMDPPNFPKYTDIQHYYRNVTSFPDGMRVVITEKIHGMNCRIGRIKIGDKMEWMAGSHRYARERIDSGNVDQAPVVNVYWRPLTDIPGLAPMIEDIARRIEGDSDVVVFGELFGPGIQDMTYGVPAGQIGFRVFDIMVDGRYLDWHLTDSWCYNHEVPVVPVLYCGPFSAAKLKELTDRKTSVCEPAENKSHFKGAEGCVVKAACETYDHRIGRVIAKSVSADYLGRKEIEDAE